MTRFPDQPFADAAYRDDAAHTVRRRRTAVCCCVVVGAMLALMPPAVRAQAPTPAEDLKRMTLEELMGIEVSTVSRVAQPSGSVPAAVYVLTQDDIRRSGATTLPEALRLVPGMQVARLDTARYAIGVRGFADRLARSMLVLMDGRAVYSPLFAGTYWEVQNTLLQDVERIEVIRGPGGTLWGANAVNGIINIITKHAGDTQGALVHAAAGTHVNGLAAARVGGTIGGRGHFRAYAQGADNDPQYLADGPAYDTWRLVQGGFRADWTFDASRAFTLQGDVYHARLGSRLVLPSEAFPYSTASIAKAPLSGGNLLARWSGRLFDRGDFRLQTYYDRTSRDERPVAERRQTFDVDWQHHLRAGRRHSLVWGAGYRVTGDEITALPPTRFDPPARSDHLFSVFLQDDVSLIAERLRLIAGAKVEHNAYSGAELQPSGRIAWSITRTSTLWGSVTRAVRTPSRVETDYTTSSVTNPAIPAFVQLQANPGFVPEELIAYETGFRMRPIARLFVTLAGFYNAHDHMLSTELLTPVVDGSTTPPRLILPIVFGNGLHGSSHGVEATADARPVPWWRMVASYSLLHIQMTRDPGSNDVSQERRYEGLSPRHQLQVDSSLDLPHAVSVDWMFRYISALPAGPVPSYATSDVKLGWQAGPRLDLALVLRNLHQARHLEWAGGAGANVQIERSAAVSLTWRR